MKNALLKVHNSIMNVFYKIHKLIENSKFLHSIRQGFSFTIPVFLIGAIALALQNLPIEAYRTFIQTFAGGIIDNGLTFINTCTYGFASVHILISITLAYSLTFERESRSLIVLNLITVLASYVLLLGILPVDGAITFTTSSFNVTNIFAALIVSYVSTRLFFLLYNVMFVRRRHKIKLNIYKHFQIAIAAVLPMTIILTGYILIMLFIQKVLGFTSFIELVIWVLSYPIKNLGRSVGGQTLVLFLEHFLWFFGIHGNNVFESINNTIFSDGTGEIVSKSFADVYGLMGGSGTMICLLISLAIFDHKDENTKRIVASSAFPMVFNISETMLFGLPVVLNPFLIIPFILVPIVGTLIAHGFVAIGFLPSTINTVFWTTPIFWSGYLSSGSWRGMFVQLIIVIVGILIYSPFVIINRRMNQRFFRERIKEVETHLKQAKDENAIKLLDEDSKLSVTVNTLVNMLKNDIEQKHIDVYFQPICNKDSQVVSTEALLRWHIDGSEDYIYPPLVVKLAKEAKIFDSLTKVIIENVIRNFTECNVKGITISVNISVSQLNNPEMVNWIVEMCNQYNLPKNTLILEITEEKDFVKEGIDSKIFDILKENGIKTSIDDFSMGSTSISYLQEHHFDYIKLDGGIVKNINDNESTVNIIQSIFELSKNLDCKVIAECVESKEIMEHINALGGNMFQGYYFSKAIKPSEYILFVETHNNEVKE